MMDYDESTLSFDVFDTALTRIWFKPVDLFVAVGRELADAGIYPDANEWARARQDVEHELRQTLAEGAIEEVGLDAIHTALADRLAMDRDRRDLAMAMELRLEREAMRPIAETRAAIAAARQAGKQVIFLSDTYFEPDFVADILSRVGIEPEKNALYTSFAIGRTKRTGSLFSHVLADRGLAPASLRHTGDNFHSDVTSARKHGLQASLFVPQKPTRYERLLYARRSSAPRLLRAAAAGAARAARLGVSHTDRHLQTIAETSADVAGPMLTGFTLWVLMAARARGLKRLYFLARDGQILLRIAERLNAWLGWGMELRYLYASRQSLFLPSITALDGSTLDWLTEKADKVSLRAILSRIELVPEAEADLLTQAGFGPGTWDQKLGPDGARRLGRLLQDPGFIGRVLAVAEAHRAILLDYLAGEGVADGTPFGLVDIGWKGRLQLCLGRVLASRPGGNPTPLTGFYWGLNRRPDPAIAGELFTYIDTKLPDSALLETFVKADHGSVRRFRRNAEGRAEPELLEEQDHEALDWGIAVQQRGIIDFVDFMLAVLKPSDATPDILVAYLRERSLAIFDRYAQFPSPAEAAAYGSVRHAADQTHAEAIDIAPVLSRAKLVSLLLSSRTAINRQTTWLEGSITRATTSPGERAVLLAARDARRRAWAAVCRVRGTA
jgi:FMN phosphatase YigB (HAD superfamily)